MFNTDHQPPIGEVEVLAKGLRVVTAPNASPMTFTGTRSYILGEGEVAVIDPGPLSDEHFDALMRAVKGQTVSHILVTHSHIDHSPLAARLAKATGAQVMAFGPSGAGMSETMRVLLEQGGLAGGEGIDRGFSPDFLLKDGDVISGDGWQLEAVHTPGHMSNHLCFAWEKALFSGDHVMGWSTTLVSPPDGDLTQFMTSLQKLEARDEDTYYPGHGAPLQNAQAMLAHQFNHRKQRESQILEALAERTVTAISKAVYHTLDPRLMPMAERNVFAHLIDLHTSGRITCEGALNYQSRFRAAN